jgi:hypothetical protein
MERGGGEREDFKVVSETPRATEGAISEAQEHTDFAPIAESGSIGPVPAPVAETPEIAPTKTEEAPKALPIIAEDIRRELPLDELDGFEDKILAGMEE